MLLPTLRASSLLLCMLCFAGSQWRVNARGFLYQLENVLWQNCEHVASFLPLMCKAAPLGPACCGLMSVVSFCRTVYHTCSLGSSPSCNRQWQSLGALLYDGNVCESLRLTAQVFCQGPDTYDLQCQRLHQLTDLMCNPYVTWIRNSGGSYELPELGDCELTGLIDDNHSERKDFQSDMDLPDCTGKDKLSYRTIDGSCNNLQNPRWGKSFEPQKRLLPSQLVQGNFPRTLGMSGNPLPSVRVISQAISPLMDVVADVSNMVMAWGQFIDHDFTGTPVTKNGSQSIECCGNISDHLKVENGGPCFPIPIPVGDPLGRPCMEFVRSLALSFPNGTHVVPREQINALTSYLDASAVYGSTLEELSAIQGYKGKMKVIGNNMLPENPFIPCTKEGDTDYCLLAGDKRVNVFVGLGVFHTTFVREHNRIVDVLSSTNPQWDEFRLFQEARKIVSAEFQHVTFAHWLPAILNDVTLTTFRLKPGDFRYDRTVDPTVFNVFSTAAFRFGHSQVKQIVKIGGMRRQLQDTLMRPKYVLSNMADVIRGLSVEPTDAVDRFMVDGMLNHLFETSPAAMDGLDIVSLNTQRGRDHGLPPFNDYREFCGLPRIIYFNSTELTVDLSNVYESVDDVDIFVGMLVEQHAAHSLVGPTFACLLGTQFYAMKFGDRFFYETSSHTEGFTDAQLSEIKKVTLAKILCDNNPDLGRIQRDVFLLKDESNPLLWCNEVPGMDLSHWREVRHRYFT